MGRELVTKNLILNGQSTRISVLLKIDRIFERVWNSRNALSQLRLQHVFSLGVYRVGCYRVGLCVCFVWDKFHGAIGPFPALSMHTTCLAPALMATLSLLLFCYFIARDGGISCHGTVTSGSDKLNKVHCTRCSKSRGVWILDKIWLKGNVKVVV